MVSSEHSVSEVTNKKKIVQNDGRSITCNNGPHTLVIDFTRPVKWSLQSRTIFQSRISGLENANPRIPGFNPGIETCTGQSANLSHSSRFKIVRVTNDVFHSYITASVPVFWSASNNLLTIEQLNIISIHYSLWALSCVCVNVIFIEYMRSVWIMWTYSWAFIAFDRTHQVNVCNTLK